MELSPELSQQWALNSSLLEAVNAAWKSSSINAHTKSVYLVGAKVHQCLRSPKNMSPELSNLGRGVLQCSEVILLLHKSDLTKQLNRQAWTLH